MWHSDTLLWHILWHIGMLIWLQKKLIFRKSSNLWVGNPYSNPTNLEIFRLRDVDFWNLWFFVMKNGAFWSASDVGVRISEHKSCCWIRKPVNRMAPELLINFFDFKNIKFELVVHFWWKMMYFDHFLNGSIIRLQWALNQVFRFWDYENWIPRWFLIKNDVS